MPWRRWAVLTDHAEVKRKGVTRIPIIKQGKNPVSLVNLFVVRTEQQKEFVKVQVDQTTRYRVHMTGFISSTFHRSLDGVRVLNLAQWQDVENVRAARASGNFERHLDRLAGFQYSNVMHLHEIPYVAADFQPSVEVNDGIIADVDVVAIDRAAQPKALGSLIDSARRLWNSDRPQGLISIIVMASLDRESIVSYCQWRRDQYPATCGACGNREGLLPIPDLGHHDRHAYKIVASTIAPR